MIDENMVERKWWIKKWGINSWSVAWFFLDFAPNLKIALDLENNFQSHLWLKKLLTFPSGDVGQLMKAHFHHAATTWCQYVSSQETKMKINHQSSKRRYKILSTCLNVVKVALLKSLMANNTDEILN